MTAKSGEKMTIEYKNMKIGAVPTENNVEITGVNTVEQLEEMEKMV